MKRTAILVAAVLAAALMVCVMAGCSNQSTSSGSAPASASASTSVSVSASAEQSQESILTELKEALANVPAYKSVTITEQDETTYEGQDGAMLARSVYKFDASGDALKTSMEFELNSLKMQYITDGANAVCVTDGPIYSGTVEQFELAHAAGVDAFIKDGIGDLKVLIDCAVNIEKLESNGLTFYMMTLDPEKLTASDDALQLLANSGIPVKEAFLTIGFEENGSIASIDRAIVYEGSTAMRGLSFSDYDNTVVSPLPEATKTFEEMEADIQAKMDSFIEDSEAEDGNVEESELR